jgi:hypothetical protein
MRSLNFVLLSKIYYNEQIKKDEGSRACSMHGREVLVGKPETRRSLRRSRRRHEDNNNIDFKEIGSEVLG